MGDAGVKHIALMKDEKTVDPFGTMNIDGWDHQADAQGRIRILSSEYFGASLTAYEKCMERIKQIVRICMGVRLYLGCATITADVNLARGRATILRCA